jgi:hypothetical protein
MNTKKRYSPEVRERPVRLAFEHESEYDLAVGGYGFDCGEDRLHGGDATQMGAAC